MQIAPNIVNPTATAMGQPQAPNQDDPAREAFDQFFGEVFYGQMLKSLRSMTDKPAYFHGGRAEEVFRGQLDQMISEQMAETQAGSMTDAMYEVFSLQMRR